MFDLGRGHTNYDIHIIVVILKVTTVPDAINRPKHAWKGDYSTGNTRAQILTRV